MSFELDAATLALITQEARQCFLDEDAPEYLQILEGGLQNRNGSADFTSLLRAAHSLKGGAGLAQLPSLRELSHKLEDLLQALEKEQVPDPDEGWTLLELSVTEMAVLLSQARTDQDVVADPNLLKALETFDQSQPTAVETTEANAGHSTLVQTALKQDLEACFVRVEELPPDTPTEIVTECLENFFDECLLLGETLDLPWLIEGIEPLEAVLEESQTDDALLVAKQAITQLRSQRNQYLLEGQSTPAPRAPAPTPTPETVPPPQEAQAPLSHLRVPLKRLEKMTNSVGELILAQERLRLQQQQLNQTNRRLRQLARRFEPIRDQVQAFYDQLAIAPLHSSIPLAVGVTTDSPALEFDPMELDRFTDLHSSLQTFQELMLRVQETRTDLDLINRELSEDLEQVQNNLDALYTDVTQSRLVPFRLLAQRFLPQIQHLNRRYGKSAHLEIEGEDVLVDQVLLEQLQTPLTHLLNNAFDHGIEPSSERLANHKPETAQIFLKATVENNQLVISLADDGRGIDLQRVYQRALERGLCSPETSIDQWRQEEILDWIFQPDFSTTEIVSDLSGRGVGLDIVRTQIQRLRGTIQVKTQSGQRTIFTLKLPLNLSLLTLFLVQLQRRIVAIPTTSVLETLPYSELDWIETEPKTVNWHQQAVPVVPLWRLLPCPRTPIEPAEPRVGIVLDASFGPLVVTVDGLIGERQLIVKPFDDTVATPPYLAGCTILGTGEVVPVVLPQAFEMSSPQPQSQEIQPRATAPSKIPTILVVEDSVATRRLLERLLTEIGYTIVVCRDGQEGLDELHKRRGRVDLIISDVEMPRVNGFELLQKLRTDASWEQVPVVMVTSRTGERHQQQAMQLGANAYLGKPIQFQELLTTIQALVKAA
ncbi:MAG: response regulator [Xenococcaceae cyanobacterium]